MAIRSSDKCPCPGVSNTKLHLNQDQMPFVSVGVFMCVLFLCVIFPIEILSVLCVIQHSKRESKLQIKLWIILLLSSSNPIVVLANMRY